jgi:hypothetical protein
VISYKNLIEVQAKRIEKELAQETKGKSRYSRKPKNNPPDPPKTKENIVDTARYNRKHKSNIPKADKSIINTARYSQKHKSFAQDPPEPSNKLVQVQIILEL